MINVYCFHLGYGMEFYDVKLFHRHDDAKRNLESRPSNFDMCDVDGSSNGDG